MNIDDANIAGMENRIEHGELHLTIVGHLYPELLATSSPRITIRVEHRENKRSLRQSVSVCCGKNLRQLIQKLSIRLEISHTEGGELVEALRHFLRRYCQRWNVEPINSTS